MIEKKHSDLRAQLNQFDQNNNQIATTQPNGIFLLKENSNIKGVGHVGNCIESGNYCQI